MTLQGVTVGVTRCGTLIVMLLRLVTVMVTEAIVVTVDTVHVTMVGGGDDNSCSGDGEAGSSGSGSVVVTVRTPGLNSKRFVSDGEEHRTGGRAEGGGARYIRKVQV